MLTQLLLQENEQQRVSQVERNARMCCMTYWHMWLRRLNSIKTKKWDTLALMCCMKIKTHLATMYISPPLDNPKHLTILCVCESRDESEIFPANESCVQQQLGCAGAADEAVQLKKLSTLHIRQGSTST